MKSSSSTKNLNEKKKSNTIIYDSGIVRKLLDKYKPRESKSLIDHKVNMSSHNRAA